MMSELYELPDGWEWEKLGFLTKTTSGGTPKRNEKSYWNGNIGWLKSGELNDGYITKVDEFITDKGLEKSSAKIFPRGTLLIAMYGATVGRLGILDIETTTNQAICGILNDKNTFEMRYMFFYLRSIRDKMLLDSTGGAQPNLSQTYIKNLDIPLPPLPEQKRIVSKLDTLFEKIDKAIALHQKNMDEADVFIGSVLNEVFGNKIYGLGGEALEDLCELIVDCEHKTAPTQETGYPSIRTPNIGKGFLILDNVNRVSEKTYNEWTKRAIPQENDLILAREAPAGNVAVISKKLKVCLGQRTVLLRPKKDKFNSNYLAFLLLSKDVQQQLLAHTRGATVAHINMKDIRAFKIYNPLSLSEQQKTVTYLDKLSEKAEKVKSVQKEKMKSLKALKASLLDRAFRGKL